LAKDEATRVHDGSAEWGLPRGHYEDSSPPVHVQTVTAEPSPFLGEPDPILAEEDAPENEVAHTQIASAEPDWLWGELDTPDVVAHT
jgi:hypothetical protein